MLRYASCGTLCLGLVALGKKRTLVLICWIISLEKGYSTDERLRTIEVPFKIEVSWSYRIRGTRRGFQYSEEEGKCLVDTVKKSSQSMQMTSSSSTQSVYGDTGSRSFFSEVDLGSGGTSSANES